MLVVNVIIRILLLLLLLILGPRAINPTRFQLFFSIIHFLLGIAGKGPVTSINHYSISLLLLLCRVIFHSIESLLLELNLLSESIGHLFFEFFPFGIYLGSFIEIIVSIRIDVLVK